MEEHACFQEKLNEVYDDNMSTGSSRSHFKIPMRTPAFGNEVLIV